MPTSAPIHIQIVITTNPIFSIIMRRCCHVYQTTTHTHKSGGIRNSQPEVNFSIFFLLGSSLFQVRVIQRGAQSDFNGELLFLSPTFCREHCWGALIVREVLFKYTPANENNCPIVIEGDLQVLLCFLILMLICIIWLPLPYFLLENYCLS